MKFLRFVVFVFVCFVILWAMVACASMPTQVPPEPVPAVVQAGPPYHNSFPCLESKEIPDDAICWDAHYYVPYVKRYDSEIRNVMLEGNCSIELHGQDSFLIEGNHFLPKNGRCKISAMQLPKPETAYPFPVTPVPCGNVQIGGSNNQASANCGAPTP